MEPHILRFNMMLLPPHQRQATPSTQATVHPPPPCLENRGPLTPPLLLTVGHGGYGGLHDWRAAVSRPDSIAAITVRAD